MPERVLITGARAPAALDIARSFAAAGFDVHMADCAPSRMAQWSRAVKAIHRYPSPRSDPTGFHATITDLTAKLTPRLIVPTCEEVFHLAMMKPPPDKLLAPAWPILRRLHSKAMFAEDCTALGLPIPETTRITSKASLEAFVSRAPAYVFKPEYSRFGTRTLIGPEPQQLDAVSPSEKEPWVVQRRISGTEVSFYAVSIQSRLAAFSAYRSTWRFAGGAGYAFEPLDSSLAQHIRAFASTLATRPIPQGQFACDLIVDASNNPWFLECNPRATSGAHFFGRSPQLAHAMLGQADAAILGDAAPRHVAPVLWAYGLGQSFQTRQHGEWQETRRKGVDVIGAKGDAAPVLGALLDTLSFGAKALATGKTLVEVTTADIEWNGEEL